MLQVTSMIYSSVKSGVYIVFCSLFVDWANLQINVNSLHVTQDNLPSNLLSTVEIVAIILETKVGKLTNIHLDLIGLAARMSKIKFSISSGLRS